MYNQNQSKRYIQTKGKLQILFSAELKKEFKERVDGLKSELVSDNLEKVH